MSTQLLVTARQRQPGALSSALDALELPDPTLAELAPALDAIDGPLWLAGGEPTLRADLPALIARAAEGRNDGVGLISDGLALTRAEVVEPLIAAGLRRLRLTLHAARTDAHDWLVGRKGAARQVVRAMALLRELSGAGAPRLGRELSAVVTRPTMPHLAELVALAVELGAERLHLHRLRTPATTAEEVMLTPRFGLLEPYLEQAARHARTQGLELRLHDFPRCVTGQAETCRVEPPEPRRTVSTPAWAAAVDVVAAETTGPGCADCPGPPICRGAPAGYLRRFGHDELRASAHAPSTRLRDMIERARPTAEPVPAPAPAVDVIRVRFGGPARVACPSCGDHAAALAEPETTRELRRRLVRAARQGASRLRIADALSMSHPAAAALLRECLLLFPSVEVAGELSGLGAMDDAALYHLEGLHRVDAALYGPDATTHDGHVGRPGAFEATLRGLERLHQATGVTVGVYAVVHDAEVLPGFARAWESGALPGAPRFRLAPEGGSLAALARQAGGLGEALTPLLPACLIDPPQQTDAAPAPSAGCLFEALLHPEVAPSGSDVHAMFEACACDAELRRRCPGLAVGWTRDEGPHESPAQ